MGLGGKSTVSMSGIMTEEELIKEYTKRMAKIMEEYVEGKLSSIEYSYELERLDIWYDEQQELL